MSEKRRRLGAVIQDPINKLNSSIEYDTVMFIEADKEAASRTRAAALMYILRKGFDLCTHVNENRVYVMQHKDLMDNILEIDIR